MRGQILGVEADRAVLLGPDDIRRSFPLSEWKSQGAPQPGQWVDFLLDGEAVSGVYAVPQSAQTGGFAADPMRAAAGGYGTSGFVLGAVGVVCLVVGLVIPVIPTLAAFIFGVIGAGRARDENDNAGLTLSRIAWIGALVLLGLGILALIVMLIFFGSMFGLWLQYVPDMVHT